MKKTLIAFFVFCLTNTAMADNHSITFKQRQASTKMNITAVQITPTSGTISAEGTMGEYGTTYLTYTLTADPDGNGGQVIGEGVGTTPGRKTKHSVQTPCGYTPYCDMGG